MAKEKVFSGAELWSNLEGKKEEIKDTVKIEFGGVKGEVTVVFRDVDVIQKISKEYERKRPQKPVRPVKAGKGTVNVSFPTEDEKYKAWETEPDIQKAIQKWEDDCEPLEKEMNYRLAYEFIDPDERPGKNIKEGVKILQSVLPYMDAVKIVRKGNELNSLSVQMGELENDS